MKLILLVLSVLITAQHTLAKDTPMVSYLKAQSVGKTPLRIGDGIFSTDQIEFNTTMSANEDTLIFTVASLDWSKKRIMLAQIKDGAFTKAKPLTIDNHELNAADPHVNWAGDRIYFGTSLAAGDHTEPNNNIWTADFDGKKATNLRPLNPAVNNTFPQSYPTTNKQGDLYFASYVPERSFEIFHQPKQAGETHAQPQPMGTINSDLLEGDFFIDPDNNYAVFVGMRWEGGMGMSDMYIIFNRGGAWSKPQSLGKSINSAAVDGSPYVTKNGDYLVFTSNRTSKDVTKFDGKLDIWAVQFNAEAYKPSAVWPD